MLSQHIGRAMLGLQKLGKRPTHHPFHPHRNLPSPFCTLCVLPSHNSLPFICISRFSSSVVSFAAPIHRLSNLHDTLLPSSSQPLSVPSLLFLFITTPQYPSLHSPSHHTLHSSPHSPPLSPLLSPHHLTTIFTPLIPLPPDHTLHPSPPFTT